MGAELSRPINSISASEQQSYKYLEKLPNEIWFHIFTFLTLKDLSSIRITCYRFKKITDQKGLVVHFANKYFDFDSSKIDENETKRLALRVYDFIVVPDHKRFPKRELPWVRAIFISDYNASSEDEKKHIFSIITRYGARNCYLEFLRHHPEGQFDYNQSLPSGGTPLVNAAQRNHPWLVKNLLMMNSVKTRTSRESPENVDDYNSALGLASSSNRIQVIQAFVDSRRLSSNEVHSALRMNIRCCGPTHSEAVEALMNDKNYSSANETNHQGWTPVMQACVKSNLSALEALMLGPRRGPFRSPPRFLDFEMKSNSGESALDCMIGVSFYEGLKLALEYHQINTIDEQAFTKALMIGLESSQKQGKETLGLLLYHKFRLDCFKDSTFTCEDLKRPFLYACTEGWIEIVRPLSKYIGDIDFIVFYPDSHGCRQHMSALMLASKYNKPEIVQFLLEKGADVNLKDDKNQTSLHYAAGHGRLEVCILLLKQKNIKINVLDWQKWTPLMNAAHKGFHEIVHWIVYTDKSHINYQNDTDSYTPLIAAVHGGSLKSVKILLDFGAKTTLYDRNGMTAYSTAKDLHARYNRKEHKEIIDFLYDKVGGLAQEYFSLKAGIFNAFTSN